MPQLVAIARRLKVTLYPLGAEMAVDPARLEHLRRAVGRTSNCIYPVQMENIDPEYLPEALEIRNEEIYRLFQHVKRLDVERWDLQKEVTDLKVDMRRMNAERDVPGNPELGSRDRIQTEVSQEALLGTPLRRDVILIRAEIRHLNAKLQTEIDGLRQELLQARSTIDYEKTARVEVTKQKQAMEKELIAMAREVEKLRAELANSGAIGWNDGDPSEAMFNVRNANFGADGYEIHERGIEKGSNSGTRAQGGDDK